jgi:uroporphyrinogen-III synthase
MRIILTPRAETAQRLAARLRAEGFEVAERPLIRVEPIPGPPLRVDAYDWLVLTSRAAVECLFDRLEGALPRVAAIGPGTAEALRERGVEPALVAKRSTQEGLVAELPRAAGRVLFAGAADARDVLARELGAEFVPLYRTVEVRPGDVPDADLAVVASASAARALAAVRPELACVSIGPVTSAAAREQGLRVVAEAETQDLDGLVAAVKLAASNAASSPS